MTAGAAVALFVTMLALAAIPGVSVMAVVSRTLAHGWLHGTMTIAGIISGDIIFIGMAFLGLAVVADYFASLFIAIKILAALILISFGMVLWRAHYQVSHLKTEPGSSLWSSYLCGFLITMGDQKAIIFYIGLLPAFVRLEQATLTDMGLTIILAALAIGSAKFAYAYAAMQARHILNSAPAIRRINMFAAVIMLITGFWLLVATYLSL